MKPMKCLAALMALAVALGGCMNRAQPERWTPTEDVPEIPRKLERAESGGVPTLSVYDTGREAVSDMDIETYVEGVVAGEMKNDWPLEALKAQAILARTFTLRFCADKSSKYKGADISTDVTEAQAYDAKSVNDAIRQAVKETRGMPMAYRGEYPYAWFHAHAGGMTELPTVSLDYGKQDPAYLRPVESRESDSAPESVKAWTARFTAKQVAEACREAGTKVSAVETVEIGEKGQSGRAKTLKVNGETVSAPSFRIAIGANRLKSTLIDDIEVDDGHVTFAGRGFGHGVGMSQWGAYAMAEQGQSAEDIIRHYFQDIDIVKLW
ncbi:MAG: SpoIID/LytB domain-containing protein [Clostridia bacterium]|nr:SpoIID/LytB domain-containing protein [Clostridia bacterium]